MPVLHVIELILGLLAAMAVLAILANRLRLPYPILFVLGGLALALVPGIPQITLAPELVLLLFLPPLLYFAAVFMSPRAVRAYLRQIALLGIGLVIVTTLAVALVAHLAVNRMPWAAAFVLGAIVSPTDPVASRAIAQRLHVPRRIVSLLEGENLFKDATALAIYPAAVTAAVTSQFPVQAVFLTFIGGATGGIIIGLGVGWIAIRIGRHLSDPLLETTVSLLIPFAAWIPAELVGVSGVLAVVSAGMYIGQTRYLELAPATRLQQTAFWDEFTFLLEGLLFILLGLQWPIVLPATADHPFGQLLGYVLIVSLTVVAIRLLWTFGAAYLAGLISRGWRSVVSQPTWRETTIIAWAGMRGALSLALALSLPLTTATGNPLPERELITFVTFGVILITLLLHGFSFPFLIQWLRVAESTEVRDEARAWRMMVQASLARLDQLAAESALPKEIVEPLRSRLRHQLQDLTGEVSEPHRQLDAVARQLEQEVLAVERQEAIRLRNQGLISDEVLLQVERDLDLEELRLRSEMLPP